MATKKKLKKEVKELFNLILMESIKYLIFLIFFIGLSYVLIYHTEIITRFDNWVIDFKTNYLVNEFIKTLFHAITLLGSYGTYLVIIIASFIIFRKKLIIPSYMTLCVGGAGVLNKIIKAFIKRPRPSVALITIPDSYSFPSGHTMCAVMFYMYMIHLVNEYIKDVTIKKVLNIVFIILPILIGLSRVYLGVHFASDVIFGAIIGVVTYFPFVKITNKIKECFKW